MVFSSLQAIKVNCQTMLYKSLLWSFPLKNVITRRGMRRQIPNPSEINPRRKETLLCRFIHKLYNLPPKFTLATIVRVPHLNIKNKNEKISRNHTNKRTLTNTELLQMKYITKYHFRAKFYILRLL